VASDSDGYNELKFCFECVAKHLNSFNLDVQLVKLQDQITQLQRQLKKIESEKMGLEFLMKEQSAFTKILLLEKQIAERDQEISFIKHEADSNEHFIEHLNQSLLKEIAERQRLQSELRETKKSLEDEKQRYKLLQDEMELIEAFCHNPEMINTSRNRG